MWKTSKLQVCVHCNFPATCVPVYTALRLHIVIESSWALVEQCTLSLHPHAQWHGGMWLEETLNDVNNMLLKSSKKKGVSGLHAWCQLQSLYRRNEVIGGTLRRLSCYCFDCLFNVVLTDLVLLFCGLNFVAPWFDRKHEITWHTNKNSMRETGEDISDSEHQVSMLLLNV